MSRRDKKGKSGGAPEWMVTYGDMMTLLLCFFVMLVSMSSIQDSKYKKAVGSLLGALGVMDYDTAIIKYEELAIPDRYQQKLETLREEFEEFEKYAQISGLEDKVDVAETAEGMKIRLTETVLFESGSARLKPEGREVLSELAGLLKKTDGPIRIEGHTDNIPISTEEFSSNWELSSARAINVLYLFAESGLPEEELAAVGRGEFRPVMPNDTPEHRKANRRVEIYADYKEALKNEPGSMEID
ncbi:MAG: OmpA family protein [Candidatus Latescibacteria bacterium]|nr:OmpA family protein [bacterium]MBD3424469.1 OmpA family protein [Candidatus Latescibacterota bacterium]